VLSSRLIFAAVAAIVVGALTPSFRQPTITIAQVDGKTSVRAQHLTGRVTVALVPSAPHIGRIILYYDASYARGRAMSDRFADGFATHETVALRYRHYDAVVDRVDADGLARLLRGSARGTCLFVPGGILPDTVRSVGRDALRGWLERGGTVVWAGTPFDAYYSLRGAPNDPGPVRGPDTSVWPALYSASGPLRTAPDIHSPPLKFGTLEAPGHAATGVVFNVTTFSVDSERLSRAGGLAIGYIDDLGESSVSVLPVGQGRVVIFADTTDNELTAAADIAQIIVTGAWFDPRALSVAAVLEPGDQEALVAVPKGEHIFSFGEAPYYFPFDDQTRP